MDVARLTTYVGERDRVDGAFAADAIMSVYARHGVRFSVVLRGVEGFGAHHRLRAAHLLTLSEDLPVVVVAIDTRRRLAGVLEELSTLTGRGLIALTPGGAATAQDAWVRLSVAVGRQERVDRRPAVVAVVDLLRRHGVAGATALLGVDGTVHGVRRRARFFAANAEVPVLIEAVGTGERVAAASRELTALLAEPLLSAERVTLGVAAAHDAPAATCRLVVYAREQAGHGDAPLHDALVRRLRADGAAGATVLRGFWGYQGDERPHGDRFWALRRHVPAITVVVDRADRCADWASVVAALAGDRAVVTTEAVAVPALSPGA
jgi:PII-like signaling protein